MSQDIKERTELELRYTRADIQKELREAEDLLRNNTKELMETLISKYGFKKGDVIGGSNREPNKIFVIKGFGLSFNEHLKEPKDDLTVFVHFINKSYKIDKKKSTDSIFSEKFASIFKVLGKYDFEKDKIIFSENLENISQQNVL